MGRKSQILLALLALLGAFVVGGCGEQTPPSEVEEGEPIEVGELEYNVILTRFLNPDDEEDSAYLAGQPELEPGELWLGVFVQIENLSDEETQASYPASQFRVTDTEGAEYEPLESRSEFALQFGQQVPPEGELPLPDTPADTGPIQGAMMLFRVDDSVTENRPLDLDIDSFETEVAVVLDI